MTDLNTMYRAAMLDIQPKPDARKGKTSTELAEELGVSEPQMRRNIKQLVKAKRMIADKDWRPLNGGMRLQNVYRFTKGAGK